LTKSQAAADRPARILLLGANGLLGCELRSRLGPQDMCWGRADLDLARLEEIGPALERLRPEVVINAAAYTHVDRAEQEVDFCFRINASAVEQLSAACTRLGAILVQISTDYVFCGPLSRTVPFREDEPACPRGVYANSKLAGEQAAALCPQHLIVRTCGLYGHAPGRKNFVETMIRLADAGRPLRVVADQHCTPSYVPHVATGIVDLLNKFRDAKILRGIYHLVNSGNTTWHGFAEEIFRQLGRAVPVAPISSAEFGAAAPRPHFSVLDTTKAFAACGSALPSWQDALSDSLRQRGAR